jgi:hypothetical protein
MGITYHLINITKKEIITFLHIPAGKAHELAGNPVSAAITTWYLLKHLGDQISFISWDDDNWPFPTGSFEDEKDFFDVTDQIVDNLIENHILIDEGREYYFQNEPEIYSRKLRNIWMD